MKWGFKKIRKTTDKRSRLSLSTGRAPSLSRKCRVRIKRPHRRSQDIHWVIPSDCVSKRRRGACGAGKCGRLKALQCKMAFEHRDWCTPILQSTSWRDWSDSSSQRISNPLEKRWSDEPSDQPAAPRGSKTLDLDRRRTTAHQLWRLHHDQREPLISQRQW